MRRSHLQFGVLCFGSAVVVAACGGGDSSSGAGVDASVDATSDASPAAEASVEASADSSAEASTEAGPEASADASADSSAEASADTGAEASADASTDASADAGSLMDPQPVSPYIVVDQFGYRTSAEKIAVVRSPQIGFDTSSFTPGAMYALVDAHTGQKVQEAAPAQWNAGATDPSSGDKAWWFDFSGATAPGDYFVLDETHMVRSNVFRIADDVYASVLKDAVRAFYYQRDGIAKPLTYAENASWADNDAHPQDSACTLYSAAPDAGLPMFDLHGGWFNDGSQNKYTSWAASSAIELLRAYVEAPAAFGDADNVPESGNGVADVLDEARWGLDWLARMQLLDGSVLAMVGNAIGGATTNGRSPPSSDVAPCVYGPASASATWAAAAAFAYGSIVFQSVNAAYAATLRADAVAAWNWATSNPAVTFNNYGIIGTYEQEVSAAARAERQVQAAAFLFELTGGSTYKSAFESGRTTLETSFDPFRMEPLDTALEYTKAANATGSVVSGILSTFESNVEGAGVFGKVLTNPYRAYIPSYATKGSNEAMAAQGNMFYDLVSFGIVPASASMADASADAASGGNTAANNAKRYAEGYIHYLHGVNPLGLVYLSNMGQDGAEAPVTKIFTAWFSPESGLTPPPGLLVAGPNPSYTWDACCPSGCGSPANNALCGAAPLSPPAGQPDQKSYKDFNADWPLDSWQVSEPNNLYQAAYIRLLAKFVP
ncbi:MAG: glycoside hydrolase family 9 protein [Polyangiaceae bacterium]